MLIVGSDSRQLAFGEPEMRRHSRCRFWSTGKAVGVAVVVGTSQKSAGKWANDHTPKS